MSNAESVSVTEVKFHSSIHEVPSKSGWSADQLVRGFFYSKDTCFVCQSFAQIQFLNLNLYAATFQEEFSGNCFKISGREELCPTDTTIG